jgi:hypothetical protein
MRVRLLVGFALAASAAAVTGAADGRHACNRPSGHRVGQCRFGVHGTPDLSRAEWRRRSHAEVSISVRIESLAGNPARRGATIWPLLDSLAQPVGELRYDPATQRFAIASPGGRVFFASSVRVRGRGCAANLGQQRRFTLVQVHAAKSRSHGTQAFLATEALDTSSPSGAAALAAFREQRGTGCAPAGRIVGRVRSLRDPQVGAHAHARLSNGQINSVDEYDAKPDFGNVVYFMTNTTSVSVGGIARGMVRVGTPVAKVDQFKRCDPNSDGTLTWRYWAISTQNPERPRIYGWIPARCPTRHRH